MVVRYFLFILSCSLLNCQESFKTVKIGQQVWMAENLNVDTFRNGDPIPEAKTDEDWILAGNNGSPAFCYYENDLAKGVKNGKLYNWYAVTDIRGLAPEGWRIATDGDWTELVQLLGGDEYAGEKLKCKYGWGEDQDSHSGFDALPSGYRNFREYYGEGNMLIKAGEFVDLGDFGYWWSADEFNQMHAWARVLMVGMSSASRVAYSKGEGLSVRCIKEQ